MITVRHCNEETPTALFQYTIVSPNISISRRFAKHSRAIVSHVERTRRSCLRPRSQW